MLHSRNLIVLEYGKLDVLWYHRGRDVQEAARLMVGRVFEMGYQIQRWSKRGH